MQMRHSPRPLAALLSAAALSFLPGCESTKSSGPSPTDTQQPAPMSTDTASWRNARVGDRVTYTFSANQGAGQHGGARALSGQATLEVVAVQQPWVWVRLAFEDAAGKPLAQAKLAQELIIPVRADTTRPLDVPHRGEATAEKPSTAGLTWEAVRYVEDSRPVDGPLQTRVYANEPGPLYLTHGLLEASTELAGFRTPGGFQLKLREFREGEAGAKATPPSLERPLGPGAYYDRRVEVGPSPSVQRVCFGAERGFILRTEGPVDTSTAPCSDFSQADPQPLEEALLGLPWDALTSEWPPASAAAAAPGKFTVEGRDVPALTAQNTENVEGVQRVFSETYAADPWAPALAGLPHEARFQPLSSGTERVAAGGKREPEGGTRLVRWGTWAEGSQK
ncbi:hypothetical protein JRI60_46060 [Archangium violaceum]|uniref:DUF6068 family protein n=1 Tax=Archangium violaceum TaxID=83451 RepID=UPI001950517B|nr:DUF6068 family protein [Archangium violaceum]QRN96306.1 hypothetical protein JRI60_46060 [Archangium violaceum]